MLTLSWHGSGPVAFATRLREVTDRRVGSLKARDSSPIINFENIFLPPSGARLTSNSRDRNLTK